MINMLGGNKLAFTRVIALMIVCVVSVFFVLYGDHALAQVTSAELGAEQFEASGLVGGGSLTVIIARVIRAFFGLLGIAAVGYFVYGGVLWMTAAGDETKVANAKKVMINATIGMAIMLASFAIASFIIRALLGAQQGGGGVGVGPAGGVVPPGFVGGGALGQAIEYVIPEPFAKDVYRDTAIVVQFKHQVAPDSIFESVDDRDPQKITGVLDTSTVVIYRTAQGEASALTAGDVTATLQNVVSEVGGVEKTRSLLTIVLNQGVLLGSPQSNTDYAVKLGPQVQRFNDAGTAVPLFASIQGYEWFFTVGTEVDLFPPRITSVYPSIESTGNWRNVTVLINFNKSMMPSTILDGQFIDVRNADGVVIDGVWGISNVARTAEFRTNVECGESACGDTFYCFDPNITVEITVTPGQIDTDRGSPKAVVPYNGLVSITGNSLDGNNSGEADGPAVLADDDSIDQRDTVFWTFGVGEDIDVTGPAIEAIQPNIQQSGVPPEAPLTARYNEIVLPSSIGSAVLRQPTGLAQWFYPRADAMDASNQLIADPETPITKTQLTLVHAAFLQSTPQFVYSYMPSFPEGIKDAQNNCYVPAAGPGCAYAEGDFTNTYCCNGQKEVPKVVGDQVVVGYECTDSYQTLQGQ